MDETSFFKRYEDHNKAEVGIPNFTMNKPIVPEVKKGTIGLELEMEGRNLRLGGGHLDGVVGASTGVTWEHHEDGSLRNGGREFVLTGPCDVSEIDPLLEGLFSRLALYKATVENSNRCSTHVHVNVGGKKINEITSIIALWYMLETPLIEWCGEERKNNHFCLSNRAAPSTMRAWQGYLRTGRRPSSEGLKYSALNVLPIWRFGSIEFRCGAAAHEPTQPASWAKFLAALVDYASTQYPSPDMIASACSEQGAVKIFYDICEKAGTENILRETLEKVPDFEEECMRNLREVQPIVLGFPWNDWRKEIEKEFVPNPFENKQDTLKRSPRGNIPMDIWPGLFGNPDREDPVNNWPRVRGGAEDLLRFREQVRVARAEQDPDVAEPEFNFPRPIDDF